METHILQNETAWLQAMVERWKEVGGAALAERGSFKVSLSGGTTPDVLYKKLASIDWPWSSTVFFIGDERWVPLDHSDSNYRMIYESFYPHRIRLERWKTEMDKPLNTALDYEKRIRQELSAPPRFDLVLLGIGDDGHTASLFPNTDALNEEKKLTVENRVPQLGTFRLTMTYPLLREAREIWFIAKGIKKRPWIDKMAEGKDLSFPAAKVEASRGKVHLFYYP